MKNWLSVICLLTLCILPCCRTIEKGDDQCFKIFVLPPLHIDEAASEALKELWKRKIRDKIHKCDTFISANQEDELYRLMNISHANPIAIDDLNKTNLDGLIDESEATHIVLLKYKIKGNIVTFAPEVYLAEPFKRVDKNRLSPKLSMKVVDAKILKPGGQRTFFLHALQLIPNTVIGGISNQIINNDRLSPNQLSVVREKSNTILPQILSSLAFKNVIHPFAFAMFDYSFDWYGSLDIAAYDINYTFSKRTNGSSAAGSDPAYTNIDYHLSLYGLIPMVNGSAALFSIFGTTFVAVGIGPSVSILSDTYVKKKLGLNSSYALNFGHRIFLTRRWLVEVSFRELVESQPFVSNEVFQTRIQASSIFGIGYFFPESRSLLRGKL